MNLIFEEKYKVRSTQVNLNNRLGLYGILGMLQDIASEHISYLGFSYENMIKKGYFWVLTQQKLKMKRYPLWNEYLVIKTWSLPIEDGCSFREFEIYHNGEKIGECSSKWFILDVKTRKPADFSNEPNLFYPRTDGERLDFTTNRVILPEKMNLATTFNVKISDLDVNLHVNNVKYTQWVLDMLPISGYKDYHIKEYEINFLSETFLNDKMQGYISEPTDLQQDSVTTYFYAQKEGASKPAFISKMVAEKL